MAHATLAETGFSGTTAGPAQVLIVDDSVVARSVLGRMVEGTRRFRVAAAYSDVRAALDYLKTNSVDIILLDIEMPGIDGITALPDVIAAGKGAKVLIVSSAAEQGAAVTVQALALGAADTLVKPGIGAFGGRFAEVLEERLSRLLEAHVHPVPEPVLPAHAEPAAVAHHPHYQFPVQAPDNFDLVAIGASTGGIHALSQLLRAIPASFRVPILVTQHLPVSFMSYFATQLAVLGGRPCEVATDRMRIRPGRIIVAPGDAHMRVVRMSDGAAIRLTHEKASSGCMPSVDPMFESVAEVFGARALGVVLSGMGRDGCEGAKDLIDAGAKVLAQDRASSVVWGMPGAVANAGRVSAILPPDEIGRLIARGGGGA
ncbi:two-component system chemotaxis response regulator CheB [Sphingomonas kyeonggiensis]|uniref:Protein-glutamate methylesterase/protein-glutamine glutaminase n=2 Tax=Sphingomonas kyeonggiensis TaxID=1268553 RepID=A0A7W7NSZ6_9SPHN|nr:chemotaxis-specific protein-glutamate methyltransferase CheB [Sphingomonas kyeonggiensis]MBB4839417.1 two-component system chemotaxis response regulator CheB [Sphingomonas kyeonggiensis]